MFKEGQKPIDRAEFDIEIRETHPGTAQWVRIPEDPKGWIQGLRKSLEDAQSVYVNIYSILGDQIEISINSHLGRYDNSLCFGLQFETLDRLKRAIDFVHGECLRSKRMDEVSATAPK